MGRIIRRVPSWWEHPKGEDGAYKPVHDANYEDACNEWMENAILWHKGEHPSQKKYPYASRYYWQWTGSPPDEDYYRSGNHVFTPEEATHWQMYENTTEGTPISPVFATAEECARWCADNAVSFFGGMTTTYEHWLSIAKGGFGGLVMSLATNTPEAE